MKSYDKTGIATNALPARKLLLLCAIGSIIFVFYGSLVPFDFIHKSFQAAWTEFGHLLSNGLIIRSRADVGANFLLMIPAGFFMLGFLWPNNHLFLAFFSVLIALTICILASITAEFSQIYFQGRTPAFSDILMQTAGTMVGMTVWGLWGRKIWNRFFEKKTSATSMSLAEKILWIYLLCLFIYNIVPLDISLSPYYIYMKYKVGRLLLVPFSFQYDGFWEFIYAISTDIIIWIPVGFLWVFTGKKTPFMAWLWTFVAVFIIESAQIFIASRIFSVTDILTGAIGGGIGVFLFLKLPFQKKPHVNIKTRAQSKYKSTWIGLGFFFLWCIFLALLFWYPYKIQIQRKFVESQIERFFQVPFYAYYYSRPLQALTAVFQKTLFFMPLGVFLAIAVQPFRKWGVNSLFAVISFLLCAGVGLAIELGQVLMPNKLPDSTDLFFETAGGMLGYWIACIVRRKMDADIKTGAGD